MKVSRRQPYYGHNLNDEDVYKQYRTANSEVLATAVGSALYDVPDAVAYASMVIAMPGKLDMYLFNSDAVMSKYTVAKYCKNDAVYEDPNTHVITAVSYTAETGPTVTVLTPAHLDLLDFTDAMVYIRNGYKNVNISTYRAVEELKREMNITLGNRQLTYVKVTYSLALVNTNNALNIIVDTDKADTLHKRLPTYAYTHARQYMDKTFDKDVDTFNTLWAVEIRSNTFDIFCDGSKGIINGTKINNIVIPEDAAYPSIAFSEDNLPVVSYMTEECACICRAYRKGRTIAWEVTSYASEFDDFAVINDASTRTLKVVTYEREISTLTEWFLFGEELHKDKSKTGVPQGLRFNDYMTGRVDLLPTYFINSFKHDVVEGKFYKMDLFVDDVIVHSRNPNTIMDTTIAQAIVEVLDNTSEVLVTEDPFKANIQREIDSQLGEV